VRPSLSWISLNKTWPVVDSIVKQRLVGALILLALGVVFWPIIFVPESRQPTAVSVAVPQEPPVDLSPVPEPDNLGLRSGGEAQVQGLADEDAALPPSLSGDDAPPALPAQSEIEPVPELADAGAELAAPALDEDGLPVAFTLQVATMGDRERAERLRDELVGAGYKGYVKRLRRDDRVLYRVLVGPRYTRDELLPVKAAIDEAWQVESLIMRYFP
jgi:DedD protein